MNNYQLYRTNTLLSGQLAWDITLDADKGGLYISDFQLSPVSGNLKCSKKYKSKLLTNTHLENIKQYYSNNKSIFYDDGSPSNISSTEPLYITYSGKHEYIDPHDSNNEMGLVRSKYSITGRTLEFFCPVWLEDLSQDDVLKFNIVFKYGEHTSITKTVEFKQDANHNFHNRFVSYFKQYISDINLDGNLIKYDLKNISGILRSVSAENGNYVPNKDVTPSLTSLLQSEKLLMDADNIIISNFKNYRLIARQLFNFRFLFDYEDIIPYFVLKNLMGETLDIDIHVYKNNELLERKDFYSNYDYIKCLPVDGSEDDVNIFSLLKDNQNIELTTKNKITQNIIHWAVEDNNEYIFNLYTGFGGFKKSNSEEIIRIPDNYQNLANAIDKESSMNWCNGMEINNNYLVNILPTIVQSILDNDKLYSVMGNRWLNGILFETQMKNPVNVSAISLPTAVYKHLCEKFENSRITLNFDDKKEFTIIFFGYINGKCDLMIIAYDESYKDEFSFYKFKQALTAQINSLGDHESYPILYNIYKWINTVAAPSSYKFPSLGYSYVLGPEPNCDEVNHVLRKNNMQCVTRYGGNISPAFVNPELNKIYYKKIIDPVKEETEFNKFTKYSGTYFKKYYKSIGYYPYNDIDVDLKNVPDIKLPYEYKWYGKGNVILLNKDLELSFTELINTNDNIIENVDSIINENMISQLYRYYHCTTDDHALYISNQYNKSVEWSYEELGNNIRKYTFNIKLTLK